MLKISHYVVRRYLLLILVLAVGAAHAADTTKGGELYAAHCADCHGVSGVSNIPDAPDFSRNEGLMKPDTLLLEVIAKGNNAMPSYLGMLSDQDMLDVIAFLRTLN